MLTEQLEKNNLTSDLTLVILAAGLGSRFGGDKQIAALGANGETMLELALKSAYKAGFRKSVLVIRPELETELATRLSQCLPLDFDYQFCYQHLNDLPNDKSDGKLDIDISHRQKPWGTAHALYAARNHVTSAMAVINADDYYGDSAFELLAQGLTQNANDWMMVAYPLALTLSDFGGVNRGVCQVNNGLLTQVTEWTDIRTDNDDNVTNLAVDNEPSLTGVCNNNRQKISSDALVSMTCWGFQTNIFADLEQALNQFIKDFGHDSKKECFLPDVVQHAIENKQSLRVAKAKDNWLGVTYPQDADWVKAKLKQLADGEQR